jgi:hypothetical protein
MLRGFVSPFLLLIEMYPSALVRSVVSFSSSTLSRHTVQSLDSGGPDWLTLDGLLPDVAVRRTVFGVLPMLLLQMMHYRRASGHSRLWHNG